MRRDKWCVLLVCCALLAGCKEKKSSSGQSNPRSSARALFDQATREFSLEDRSGPDRQRWLEEASKSYEQVLKEFPAETNLCAQSLRALGSIRALQGQTNEAVKLYATVGDKYASQDWEVLQAWKSAGDLLWESNQRDDAKKFYVKVVERFDKSDAPQIISTVVRGSKARLKE
jgi:hypothetical protein